MIVMKKMQFAEMDRVQFYNDPRSYTAELRVLASVNGIWHLNAHTLLIPHFHQAPAEMKNNWNCFNDVISDCIFTMSEIEHVCVGKCKFN